MKKYIYLFLFSILLFGVFFFSKNSLSQTDTNQDTSILSSDNTNNLLGSADITISWQTLDSYTPAFYEGKPLPEEEANIKAVAYVNVNTSLGFLEPGKLFYEWYYNDSYADNWSKIGGNIIYFTLDKLQNTNTVKLIVYTDSSKNQELGEKKINITPYNSPIPLYKKDTNPLITYSNAINKKYTDYGVNPSDNFTIIAEPLYFSAKNPLDTTLTYSWSENSGNSLNGNSTNSYNYTVPDDISSSGITLNIANTNSDKNLQEEKTSINFRSQ